MRDMLAQSGAGLVAGGRRVSDAVLCFARGSEDMGGPGEKRDELGRIGC